MSNQLKVDKVQAIKTLKEQGWSNRKIARELGIHRTTVAKHLGSKPTKVPIGSRTTKRHKEKKKTRTSKRKTTMITLEPKNIHCDDRVSAPNQIIISNKTELTTH